MRVSRRACGSDNFPGYGAGEYLPQPVTIDFLTTRIIGSEFNRNLADTEAVMTPPGQEAAMIAA
jgi:hypothetical protein